MDRVARLAERGLRRFVSASMHSPLAWPVLSGSLLAAIALGVSLGQSSISQINPIYFEAPPVHPRDRGAAIDESNLHRRQDPYLQYYGWEQGQAALASECSHCGVRPPRETNAYSAQVPYFGTRADLHRAVADARDELGEEFAAVQEDLSARVARIDRYAHYPVTVEPPKDDLEITAEPEPQPVPADFGMEFQK